MLKLTYVGLYTDRETEDIQHLTWIVLQITRKKELVKFISDLFLDKIQKTLIRTNIISTERR